MLLLKHGAIAARNKGNADLQSALAVRDCSRTAHVKRAGNGRCSGLPAAQPVVAAGCDAAAGAAEAALAASPAAPAPAGASTAEARLLAAVAGAARQRTLH